MSTLKVTNIQNRSGGSTSSVDEIYSGRAKAWVNFDGAFGTSPFTIANGGIRASFNVSSITDNGTGDYTLNFTNVMPDANYCLVGTAGNGNTNNRFVSQVRSLEVGALRIGTIDGANSVINTGFVFIAVFR